MVRKMDEYSDITDIMKATPAVPPPADFTDRVMSRVSACDPCLSGKIRQILSQWSPRQVLKALFATPATAPECCFCFIMAGCFYFIMGIVLFVGLRAISGDILGGGLMYQPLASFVIAFGLGALGILLHKKSLRALKTVRLGILIYCGVVIVSGVSLQVESRIPFNLTALIGFIGGGLLMGAFLTLIVHKYHAMLLSTAEELRD
ncbi:hypothetical protein KKG22_05600, partial [Patescibacteria group bacterium]|nr:hypothetical protein [Patescibacteria group bacterium]